MKYKYFIAKSIGLAGILCMLFLYQVTMTMRAKDVSLETMQTRIDQLEQTQQELVDAGILIPVASEATQQVSYTDGTYEGSGTGFGGTIRLSILVKNNHIDTVTILEASGEDDAYLTMAKTLCDQMAEQQTVELDAISGATYSSNGILEAAKHAIAQATKGDTTE